MYEERIRIASAHYGAIAGRVRSFEGKMMALYLCRLSVSQGLAVAGLSQNNIKSLSAYSSIGFLFLGD